MADNGFHYTSLAIKKEFKPSLDDIVKRLSVKSLAALMTAVASDPDAAVAALEPLVAARRQVEQAARLANVQNQLAAKVPE